MYLNKVFFSLSLCAFIPKSFLGDLGYLELLIGKTLGKLRFRQPIKCLCERLAKRGREHNCELLAAAEALSYRTGQATVEVTPCAIVLCSAIMMIRFLAILFLFIKKAFMCSRGFCYQYQLLFQ